MLDRSQEKELKQPRNRPQVNRARGAAPRRRGRLAIEHLEERRLLAFGDPVTLAAIGQRFVTSSNGDTFDGAWLANGNEYMQLNDGTGFNNSTFHHDILMKVSGTPEDPSSISAVNLNPGTLGNSLSTAPWSSGLYEVDGVLYQMVNYANGDLQNWVFRNSSLIKSTDGGINWTNPQGQTNVMPPDSNAAMFTDPNWTQINFVKYGQGGVAPNIDNAQNYVYLTTRGQMLTRVLRTDLPKLDITKFQYYTGGDGMLDSNWSSDITQAADITPGLADGITAITYNSALGLYIKTSFQSNQFLTTPWQTSIRVYTSSSLWGTWTKVDDENTFKKEGDYTSWVFLQNKYTSADGQKMWASASGASPYGLQFVPFYLTTQPVTTIQSENAANTIVGGSVVTSPLTGWNGSGYVTGLDASGDSVSSTFNVASSGGYLMQFRYETSAYRDMDLYVNGTKLNTLHLGNSEQPYATQGAAWTFYSVPLWLNAGANAIKLQCPSSISGNVNLDVMKLALYSTNMSSLSKDFLGFDQPSMNAIANPPAIGKNAGLQTVNLSGIAGGGSGQQLQVTASSSNTALIPNPTVNYASPSATGSLTYTPLSNQTGSSVVTVTVRDSGTDGTLGNADDGVFQRTFTVTVNDVIPNIVKADLSSYFNYGGIVVDSQTFPTSMGWGGGTKYAVSGNLLGNPVLWNSASYNIGPTNANDLVGGTGQTITLPTGNYSTLSFLGFGSSNQLSQTFVVNFTDGTHQNLTQSLSNVFGPSQGYANESTAVSMSYRDASDGSKITGGTTCMFGYSFTLTSGKTVASITMPNNSSVYVAAIDLVPVAQAPALTAAASRMTHGSGGPTYDVQLPLTGNSGIEPRNVTNGWSMVLTSDKPIASVGSASVTTGTGTAGTASVSGNSVIVPITGATNAQSLTLTLTNVQSTDGGLVASAAATVRLLRGDINGDGSVNISDINLTKAMSGGAIATPNFRRDINVDGAFNISDINLVKAQSGATVSGGATGDTAPTISSVSNQTVNQDQSTAPIAFTIGDTETAPVALYVSATSNNQTLLPDATSYAFGGSGTSRTVTITPAAGQSGSATVTLSVSDGQTTTKTTFTLTVSASFMSFIPIGTTQSDTVVTAGPPAVDLDAATATVHAGTSLIGANQQFTSAALAAPTVTGVSPNSGSTNGQTVVTVTGTNFVADSTTVKFGNVVGTNVTVTSATSLTVTSPAKAAGAVDVTVTTTGGTSATGAADKFTYVNVGTGIGLTGQYFADMALTNLALNRTDATVNFDWGSGSPDPIIPPDSFSARWTGQVQAQYSETYTFYTDSNDGVRLWVNGQQLVNNWTNHGVTENSGTIALVAGQKYDIKMEYYENAGTAVAKLLWSSASTAKQVIPTSQLYVSSLQLPAVSGVSPSSGPTTGGTSVTITGTRFTGATTVKFGSTAATGLTINSDTSITATSPIGATGTVDVTVTTPSGISDTSASDKFTYVGPAVVTGITPQSGPTTGGNPVDIVGVGFTDATAIHFGGITLDPSSFLVNATGTVIYATAPAKTAGTVDITVTTPAGTSALTSADHYTYQPRTANFTTTNYSVASGNTVFVGSIAQDDVQTGDFNADGKLDIVSVHNADDTVSILINKGDGTFNAPVSYASGISGNQSYQGASWATEADFNGDQKFDLLVTGADATHGPAYSVLMGNGDGTFSPAVVHYDSGVGRGSPVVADFNGDGKLDLASENFGSGFGPEQVSLFLGNGNGTFQTSTVALQFTYGALPRHIASFKAAGKTYLAVAAGGNEVDIAVSNGNGTFSQVGRYSLPMVPNDGTIEGEPQLQNPEWVTAGDLNGDGNADLVTADYDHTIDVLLGNGDGTFRTPVGYTNGLDAAGYIAGEYARNIVFSDMNGDGKLDLVISNIGFQDHQNSQGQPDPETGSVAVMFGNGDGTFDGPIQFTPFNYPGGLAVADFNSDGRPDIAVNQIYDGHAVEVMLNSTSFPPPALTAAASRLTHGAGGPTYDVPLPLSGATGVEDRNVAGGWKIVLTFDKPIASVASAAVTAGTGTAGSASVSGNAVIVPITSATNAQLLTLTLTNVQSTDGGFLASAAATVRLLRGDINGDGLVNISDINLAKAVSGGTLATPNFRRDINADGSFNISDINLVKAQSGMTVSGGATGDTAPTISSVSDQTVNQDQATSPIPFTIGDAETAPAALYVSATSNNQTLLPDATSYAFGGSGASRTVTITPAAAQSGSATITLSVSDGQTTTRTTFTLAVNASLMSFIPVGLPRPQAAVPEAIADNGLNARASGLV